ncbi:MAG: hypothetical protein ACI9W4_000796 [Rhodothermales bacterium]|jgi:hypothetical protein
MRPIITFLSLAVVLVAGCTQESTPEAPVTEAEETVALSAPDATNAAGLDDGTLPVGWRWRFDRGSDYTVGTVDTMDTWFVTMTPGWHITTKPAGIFYHPASVGEGLFTASTKIHLFDPGTRNEGYGLIMAGANLEAEEQHYLYFLLRRNGEFLVKVRDGSQTEELIGWTEHEAIERWTDDSEGTITNVVSVTVGGDTISFMVNDEEVATLEKGDMITDGVVGIRLNHSVNVHVSDLTVTPTS